MMLALLPLLFIALILGFTAIEQDFASIPPPALPSQTGPTNVTGQQFMLYHNAVMAYAQSLLDEGEQNYSSFVPANALPPTITVPAGASAVVVSNSPTIFGISGTNSFYGSGYVICVWMPAPAGTALITASEFGQDRTIGTVAAGGTTWVPAVTTGSNSTVQSIPLNCIDQMVSPQQGDIISVSGLGGN